MLDTRIILAGMWIALMLTYLLGDVLRIFAGHATPGQISGVPATQGMWLLGAVIMLIPILMIVLTLTVYHPAMRWVTIIAAAFLIIFNLVGLPYEGAYDNFLIAVSLVFNGLTIWYAWQWAVV